MDILRVEVGVSVASIEVQRSAHVPVGTCANTVSETWLQPIGYQNIAPCQPSQHRQSRHRRRHNNRSSHHTSTSDPSIEPFQSDKYCGSVVDRRVVKLCVVFSKLTVRKVDVCNKMIFGRVWVFVIYILKAVFESLKLVKKPLKCYQNFPNGAVAAVSSASFK